MPLLYFVACGLFGCVGTNGAMEILRGGLIVLSIGRWILHMIFGGFNMRIKKYRSQYAL